MMRDRGRASIGRPRGGCLPRRRAHHRRLELGRRDLDRERRAPVGFGLDPDAPAHHAHEFARDVETEAGAADPAGHVRVEAIELLEDAPVLGVGDPEALVTHSEADSAVVAPDPELDRAAVRRVLDRVLDEVLEHLAELARVGRDGRQRLVGVELDP